MPKPPIFGDFREWFLNFCGTHASVGSTFCQKNLPKDLSSCSNVFRASFLFIMNLVASFLFIMNLVLFTGINH